MKNVINGIKIWKKYWKNNCFNLFDIGSCNKNNFLFIHGRNDDVINIRGHRLGSAEVEAVVMRNKNVIEASAIAVFDNLEGAKIVLFICVLKETANFKYTIKKFIRYFINIFT